jgi:hypothetical protein
MPTTFLLALLALSIFIASLGWWKFAIIFFTAVSLLFVITGNRKKNILGKLKSDGFEYNYFSYFDKDFIAINSNEQKVALGNSNECNYYNFAQLKRLECDLSKRTVDIIVSDPNRPRYTVRVQGNAKTTQNTYDSIESLLTIDS